MIDTVCRAILDNQALGVNEPNLAHCLLIGHPLLDHGQSQELSRADRCLTSAVEQEHIVEEIDVGDSERAQNTSQGHRGRALYVVVESTRVVSVFFEQTERVGVGEILELNQTGVAVALLNGLNELVDKLVVGGARGTSLTQTDVVGVLEEGLIVCAHIERDRQALIIHVSSFQN